MKSSILSEIESLGYRASYLLPREVNLPKERFCDEYFCRTKPVILCGNIGQWRALSEWSPEWLKEEYGNVKVHASLDIPRRSTEFRYWGARAEWIPLGQFVDYILNNETVSYTRQAPARFFPAFDDYYDFNVLLDMTGRQAEAGLWFGSKDTDSGVHWDTESNFLAQIYGHKRVILFPPENGRYLYSFTDQIRWTQFDAFKPDFEKFKNAKNATPYYGHLNPGEVIHIPRGWWHQFVSLDVAISINCFFQPSCDFTHFLRSAVAAGPRHLYQIAHDFVRYGMLKHAKKKRIISDVPTGEFLYRIVNTAIRRRLRLH